MTVPPPDPDSAPKTAFARVRNVTIFFFTFFYHKFFQRNTLRPVQRIIAEPDPAARRRFVRDWAATKLRESQYVQVAVRCPLLPAVRSFHRHDGRVESFV